MYAEALNESQESPTQDVYDYVDLVRERAGLKGVKESWSKYSKSPDKPNTKNGMREIIRMERLNELKENVSGTCVVGKKNFPAK